MVRKNTPLSFEHRAAIAQSKREFWAAKTQAERDAQVALMRQARTKKAAEKQERLEQSRQTKRETLDRIDKLFDKGLLTKEQAQTLLKELA